jgi:hypothetical protein
MRETPQMAVFQRPAKEQINLNMIHVIVQRPGQLSPQAFRPSYNLPGIQNESDRCLRFRRSFSRDFLHAVHGSGMIGYDL